MNWHLSSGPNILPQPVTHPLSSISSSTHSSSTVTNILKSNFRRLPRRPVLQRILLAALCGFIFIYFVWSERTDETRAKALTKQQGDHAWLAQDGDTLASEKVSMKGLPAKDSPWPPSKSSGSWSGVTANELLDGLEVLPDNPTQGRSLTDLGFEADATFKLGARTLKSYVKSLASFITTSMPEKLQRPLLDALETYTSTDKGSLWRTSQIGGDSGSRNTIWMTDRNNAGHEDGDAAQSWKDNGEGWRWNLLDDTAANKFAVDLLKDSKFGKVWRVLPNGILHADTLRYLLLAVSGGIYTDVDTRRLKPISEWTRGAVLWKDGKGWLSADDRKRMDAEGGLPPPSVIVGIEADVGDRADWHDWWPRPLQIVQWTLASAPHHPIFVDALLMIQRQTAEGLSWLFERPLEIARLQAEGDVEAAEKLSEATMASDPKEGGPLGIMEWTGPGLWTDCVLRYLRVKYGVHWPDLRDLRTPLRIGDVLILPVTGFSPGVGLFGAGNMNDPLAMVEHRFAGSWKND